MSSSARVLIVTHTDVEGPGRIKDALDDMFVNQEQVRLLDEKHPILPSADELLGVVIMGGPMGACDWSDHPGLKAEAKLSRLCVRENIPLIGVCLGHQIIATALGAKLHDASTKEIGWGKIRQVGSSATIRWPGNIGDETSVLHWHGDTVDVPQHAQLLASSKKTENQAFTIGSALGLQFHAEVNYQELNTWLADKQMTKDISAKDCERIRDKYKKNNAEAVALANELFQGFAARVVSRSKQLQ